MADEGGEKKEKNFFSNLLKELDFEKVDRESLNLKDLMKDEKRSYEKENNNKFQGDKNNPLTGRKIIVEDDFGKKPNKNFLIIIPLVILVVISFFLVGRNLGKSNIDTLKDDFISYIENKNIDKLYNLIYFPEGNKEYYKESLNNFIDLYNSDIEFQNLVAESIDKDINSIKEDEKFESNSLIGVVREGNRNKFLVKITPLTILNNSIVNSKVIVGENKLEVDKLLLIPGVYKLETEYEFLKLNSKENIKYSNDNTEYSVLFNFNETTIENEATILSPGENSFVIFGPRDNAIVFLDNKNTNLTVKDFNDFGKKDMSKYSTIAVVEKSEFGLGISSIEPINLGDYAINLSVNYTNDIMLDYFMNLIRLTLEEESLALENSDINFLTTIGGNTLDSLIGWIKENIGSNQFFVRYYMSFLVDLDSFNTNIKNYSQKAFIGGFLSYKEGKFSKDEEIDESKLEEFTDKKVGFNFVFNEYERAWIVDWGASYKNIKTDNTILMKLN